MGKCVDDGLDCSSYSNRTKSLARIKEPVCAGFVRQCLLLRVFEWAESGFYLHRLSNFLVRNLFITLVINFNFWSQNMANILKVLHKFAILCKSIALMDYNRINRYFNFFVKAFFV